MEPTSHGTKGVRRSPDKVVYGIGQATVIVTQFDNKLFN